MFFCIFNLFIYLFILFCVFVMFINTKTHSKATSTRIRVCFEKGDFFLRYKWSPKTYIFKHSRKIFETLTFLLCVFGWNRKLSNTMMSYIIYYKHNVCHVWNAIVFPLFRRSCIIWCQCQFMNPVFNCLCSMTSLTFITFHTESLWKFSM